ncbi:peptidylprolyl isomerase [Haloferula sp.]|uniref:peptidylprolyl isomerase n=1 Tax=Haloferula sp. TaxID=2497595 RepID=UPI00329BC859
MKAHALLLAALTPAANADIFAHMETTRGVVNIGLHLDEAPISVANFVTLAQGTRARIDPRTGVATNEPLYVNETFFRTGNNDFSKFAQTGSGSGDNTGSPGFTIRDEFHPSLRHTGYTLSMANTGAPNSGGGGIFITGDISIPTYDDLHTIFGTISPDDSLVPGNPKEPGDSASRLIVDQIISAGDHQTTIIGITFTDSSTGESAEFENEVSLGLPLVTSTTGSISVTPGSSVDLQLPSPLTERTDLVPMRTLDLSTWDELSNTFIGFNSSPESVVQVDTGQESSSFYRFSKIEYPLSVSPSSLADLTLTVDASAMAGLNGDYVAEFDSAGTGGTLTLIYDSDMENPLSGPITEIYHFPGGNGATLIIVATGLRPIRFELGYDAYCPTNPVDNTPLPPASPIPCRHRLSLWYGFWDIRGLSDASITLPPS